MHRSYLIVHLLIRIVTEYASNKKVTSSTDLDIGLKETGLAANKDENEDKVAHTSPVIGNQKNKLENAQWHIGCKKCAVVWRGEVVQFMFTDLDIWQSEKFIGGCTLVQRNLDLRISI